MKFPSSLLVLPLITLCCVSYGSSEEKRNGFQDDRNFKNIIPMIVVHGGAGTVASNQIQGKLDGIKEAVIAGQKVLNNGGSALDAVEAAIISLENDENFNAGYGSVLNIRGEVEIEASIMNGINLDVGAVTLLKNFPNPISIARKVMTDSPHALIGGEGAKIFALEKGFETVPPESLVTDSAREALLNFLNPEVNTIEDEGGVGTVGAVAIDSDGHIAAGTSSGGQTGKAVGRIGHTPQIGSGTYADDEVGGVSSTGHGDSIIQYCLAHSIIKLMGDGIDPDTATKNAINGLTARLNNTAGAISLSNKGEVGVHFSSKTMSWAYVKNNTIFYGIERGQVLEEPFL